MVRGLYADYMRTDEVIAHHRILWDAITYPCLRWTVQMLIGSEDDAGD